MLSYSIFVFLLSFYFVGAQDLELVLAQKNIEGYPSALLFDTISSKQNEASVLDKSKIAELLESKEMQAALTKSALEYSAQELNRSGQARFLFSDPGMCEYSWVSWLPWMGCDSPPSETEQKTIPSLPLIMESSYSCY